jgi:hypothetical protein
MAESRRRQELSRGSLLSAGLADLEAHPEVEEAVSHQHEHHVPVLLGQLDRDRHGSLAPLLVFLLSFDERRNGDGGTGG